MFLLQAEYKVRSPHIDRITLVSIFCNVKLTFGKGTAEAIAKEAMKRKTGARALRAIVEEIMLPYMYEVPSREDIKSLEITKQMVEERGQAEVIKLPNKKPKSESA